MGTTFHKINMTNCIILDYGSFKSAQELFFLCVFLMQLWSLTWFSKKNIPKKNFKMKVPREGRWNLQFFIVFFFFLFDEIGYSNFNSCLNLARFSKCGGRWVARPHFDYGGNCLLICQKIYIKIYTKKMKFHTYLSYKVQIDCIVMGLCKILRVK